MNADEQSTGPKPVWNSGGVRAGPPEQTFRQYRHLLSPVSRVVTQLERQTDEADPWCHVYWASSNYTGTGPPRLDRLHYSLTNKSSGKGSTPWQSEASAFGEAIERRSGGYAGDEIRYKRRFADFAEAPVMEAILQGFFELVERDACGAPLSVAGRQGRTAAEGGLSCARDRGREGGRGALHRPGGGQGHGGSGARPDPV